LPQAYGRGELSGEFVPLGSFGVPEVPVPGESDVVVDPLGEVPPVVPLFTAPFPPVGAGCVPVLLSVPLHPDSIVNAMIKHAGSVLMAFLPFREVLTSALDPRQQAEWAGANHASLAHTESY
jgi:hypothetical protein